jgi:hypothetical protein
VGVLRVPLHARYETARLTGLAFSGAQSASVCNAFTDCRKRIRLQEVPEVYVVQ